MVKQSGHKYLSLSQSSITPRNHLDHTVLIIMFFLLHNESETRSSHFIATAHFQLPGLRCDSEGHLPNGSKHPVSFTSNFQNDMAVFHGPSTTPSSELNSSEYGKLKRRVSNESSNWDGESSGTEQSFRTAYADMPPKPRQTRFIERFESVKQLTESNLAVLQAGYTGAPPQPTSPFDGELHLRPSPRATAFLVKRKPLPDTAQKALIEMNDEADIESHAKSADEASNQNHTLGHASHGRRPSFHRTNTVFTDFLPYDQVRTWQQVDNEEYQDRRRHSLSAIALEGMKKLNLDRDALSAHSKKTANQLKKVIKQHILDKEKSTS